MLRSRYALGAATAATAAATTSTTDGTVLLPWACKACMATGNNGPRCRVCNAWRSEEEQRRFLAEQRTRKQAEREAAAAAEGRPRTSAR